MTTSERIANIRRTLATVHAALSRTSCPKKQTALRQQSKQLNLELAKAYQRER